MKFGKTAITGTITAALASLALCGAAFAGGEGEEKHEMAEKPAFEEIDTNLDGGITKAEAQDTWLAAEFENVDSDGNGRVSRSEYEEAIS